MPRFPGNSSNDCLVSEQPQVSGKRIKKCPRSRSHVQARRVNGYKTVRGWMSSLIKIPFDAINRTCLSLWPLNHHSKSLVALTFLLVRIVPYNERRPSLKREEWCTEVYYSSVSWVLPLFPLNPPLDSWPTIILRASNVVSANNAVCTRNEPLIRGSGKGEPSYYNVDGLTALENLEVVEHR